MSRSKVDSSTVSTARGVSYLWLQNIATAFARILAFAFFARLISPGQMGVYTILSLAYGGVSALMGLGMSSVVTKFISESRAKGQKVKAASLYYKSLLLSELASVLIAIGLLVLKFPAGVSGLPNSPEVSAIGIFFVIDILASIGPIASAAFYGLLEFKSYAIIYSVYGCLRPWLVILLIYEVKSLIGLVEAWVISDSILAVYLSLYLWQRLGPITLQFDTKYLLKLSSPLYLASIAAFLYGNFDQLSLIPLVSLSSLGVYGAVIATFTAYYGLISVVGSVLLPHFSSVQGTSGIGPLIDSVKSASRYVSFVAMPAAFALIAVARPALTLLVGRGYEQGATPLVILALGSIASIISLSIGPVLIVINETLLAALTSILPIPLSVMVAMILIPSLGILGASIARALSMVLGLLLTWYFVRRRIHIELDYHAIAKTALAGTVMALAMGIMQLGYYNRFLLPAYLVIGLLLYVLAMRTFKAINVADIDLLRHTIGPRFNRLLDLLSRLFV